MEKAKYLLFFFILIIISSCENEDEENFYDLEYYIELKIGNETYQTSPNSLLGEDYFESTNFYNFVENEIEYSFTNDGWDWGYVVFNNSLSEVEIVVSYLNFFSYLSNDTFNVCSSGKENLNIPLNIIQNDNQVNGIIKGEFEGYAVVEDYDNPCDYVDCCYEKITVSGKFKLKINQP